MHTPGNSCSCRAHTCGDTPLSRALEFHKQSTFLAGMPPSAEMNRTAEQISLLPRSVCSPRAAMARCTQTEMKVNTTVNSSGQLPTFLNEDSLILGQQRITCTHPLLKGFLPVLNLTRMSVSSSNLTHSLLMLLHTTLTTQMSLLAGVGRASSHPDSKRS